MWSATATTLVPTGGCGSICRRPGDRRPHRQCHGGPSFEAIASDVFRGVVCLQRIPFGFETPHLFTCIVINTCASLLRKNCEGMNIVCCRSCTQISSIEIYMPCFVVQRFNYRTASREDLRQVAYVQQAAFNPIEHFEQDTKEPTTSYAAESGGTHYVVKRAELVLKGDGEKRSRCQSAEERALVQSCWTRCWMNCTRR